MTGAGIRLMPDRAPRLTSRVKGVMRTDIGPHQPCTIVSDCMSRKTARAQVRQNAPSRRRNRMITSMP